jgi:group II intron reverse transcriptase/maturase
VHLSVRFSTEKELKQFQDLLYEKSGQGVSFTGLLEAMVSEVTIVTAVHNIKSNKGSKTAGVDRMKMDKYLQMPKEELFQLIQSNISNYKPKPAKRKYIEKANGKKRPLGIPTVLDRIIQECMRLILEPICEARFYPHSYGFRPYRAQKHAIRDIVNVINASVKSKDQPVWAVEGDIKGCFDNINHRLLLKKLWRIGIHDKRVLKIISQMLKAGYIDQDLYHATEMGTPQGGILSPLLSNVYLNDFDWYVGRCYMEPHRQCKHKCNDTRRLKWSGITPKYNFRYADDWVILTSTEQEAFRMKHELTKYFKHRMKLELSQEKTYVTDLRKNGIHLLSVKAVSSKYVKARTEYLTPHTVREVHKTLRNAFNQAVKWELMTRNPVEHATLPKEEHKTRDIWTAEVLQKALEACDDDILRLAINLAFSCSLRMGELLGLTWDCIDISPTSIELGQASIFVEKELQRVNREAMADLDGKDIMFKFPPTFASTHTALVLKTPKTKTSVRKVFLPKTVAEMLVQRKADIEELKDLFGDEFVDFNLVFCSSNGKPIEGQVINRAFNKLIEEKGLPKVVFHSLRHSSITYKLKLNGGDMKSVQGDSGHAQVKMVADVYSHIIDDDRRLNAERMEAAFYSGRQATPEPVQPAATESSADDKELLLKLLQNPEMAALLKSLAKTL